MALGGRRIKTRRVKHTKHNGSVHRRRRTRRRRH